MNAKPIIFNGDMVRTLLAGRKTQTRRVLGESEVESINYMTGGVDDGPATSESAVFSFARLTDDDGKVAPAEWCVFSAEYPEEGGCPIGQCPYGVPGSLLYVRESFADTSGMGFDDQLHFMADVIPGSESDETRKAYGVKWKPSIHMPRKASRLTLRITGVQIQMIQDISSDDCIAEGAGRPVGTELVYGSVTEVWNRERIFKPLWDSIYEKRGHGWDANPWVWCLSFEVIHKNVDEVLKEAT